MVFKDGELFMVVGSPGGPRIITTVMQTMLNVIDFKMDINEAVSAPRVHHQWMPDHINMEGGVLDSKEKSSLTDKGHKVKGYIMPCNAQGVIVMPDKTLEGASDPRGIGEPSGY
jgi:gamma-glutamyltranspeptidase / glutathione hydrolase